ncbi:MAG: hypothetical protein QOI61_2346 [Actinomycetota bacterium]
MTDATRRAINGTRRPSGETTRVISVTAPPMSATALPTSATKPLMNAIAPPTCATEPRKRRKRGRGQLSQPMSSTDQRGLAEKPPRTGSGLPGIVGQGRANGTSLDKIAVPLELIAGRLPESASTPLSMT